jgi:signal transduction histidine kinase
VPTPQDRFAAPDIYVLLLTADGRISATSPNTPEGVPAIDPALIASARKGDAVPATLRLVGSPPLRVLVTPVAGDAAGRLVVVAESLEPVTQTLADVRTVLLAGGALAVALEVAGAILLTGRALAPIRRLTQGAAGVAATGRYDRRVPLPPHRDEVWQLADTINRLIATVERTLQQQRQFLADTSHELRSPLTVVLANLNLLRRELDPEERTLSIQEATDDAHRMRHLINDLLLLAQADSARAIAHAPVRLDRLVEETAAVIARTATGHRIEVEAVQPVVVTGDAERLTQLVRNLLENVVQHTPPGTPAGVHLTRDDGWVELTVTDSGPGIDPEHLPHIWERFYRADKARSRVSGGTGLGLAIVKYIAEAHGGTARVASQPGKGTTFTVLLPAAEQAEEPAWTERAARGTAIGQREGEQRRAR